MECINKALQSWWLGIPLLVIQMAAAGMCSGANKYEPSVEWLAVSCHRRF